MSNSFSGWKYALIAVVVALGFVFALPNWFGKSAAVEIRFDAGGGARQSAAAVASMLAQNHIAHMRIVTVASGIDILFPDTDAQIQARDLLARAYPQAKVAVNLLANTPPWMQKAGLNPMNLGLDLRGGVSFLLQVDSKELLARKSAELIDLVDTALKKKGLAIVASETADNGGARFLFAENAQRRQALDALYTLLPKGVQQVSEDRDGKFAIHLFYLEQALNDAKRRAADQNRMRMASRVNSLGIAEPSVQVVGNDRILVQLPGIQDVAKAKEILGSTATLEFYLVDEKASLAEIARAAEQHRAPFGDKLGHFENGQAILLKRRVVMSGEHIVDASAAYGQQSGQPQVNVALDSAGGAQMSQITRENIGKRMATMYVEYLPLSKEDASGKTVTEVEKKEVVVNAATIQGQFSSHFQITGVAPFDRAQKLAATLRAGSLVAPVYIIEERTIGPSAGQKNIDQGINAAILGLLLVTLFMLLYYRRLGVFSIIALAVNLVLLVALMSFLGATLTLPGIAGIVLTLGMAVDANVLIYERIREEREEARLAAREAVGMGFDGALSTILDANITTLIVAIMLFSFGAGPIKGFAVTLSVGILTSMFSAIFVTRALVEFFLLRAAQPKLGL